MKTSRIFLVALAGGALLAGFGSPARASTLIDRNASHVTLKVDKAGHAVVSYVAQGKARHVLVYGAVNGVAPSPSGKQVAFKLDYSGGWGAFHKADWWKTMTNACKPYRPSLPYVVTACKASDGSYWAVQAWQQELPDLGVAPWQPQQSSVDLDVAHWTGDDIAKLEVHTDWVFGGQNHHLFGQLTYLGEPVFGYRTDSLGAPLDSFGRLVFLDTLDSALGAGWKRENSFVAQTNTGVFCYGFFPRPPYAGYPKGLGTRPAAQGKEYRLSVIGPGVSPDISVSTPGLHDFDKKSPANVSYESQMNALQDQLVGSGSLCRQH